MAVAVVAAGLTYSLRGEESSDEASTAAVPEVPASGVVVHLEREALAVMPASAGMADRLVVEIAGVAPIAAVEVWSNDVLVASEEPATASPTARLRLDWVPATPGDTVVVARAIDADGRSGQSNAIRVAVVEPRPPSVWRTETAVEGDTLDTIAARLGFPPAYVLAANPGLPAEGAVPVGTSVAVPDTAPGLADGAPEIPAELAGVPAGLPSAGPGRSRRGPGVPEEARSFASRLAIPPPTLTVTVDGDDCTAELTAEAAGGADVYVEALAPSASTFEPLAALGEGGGETAAPLGPGQHAFVALAFEGAASAFSQPVVVNGPQACEGTWTGPLRLINGQLTGGKHAERAYLYLSTTPGRWIRVPGPSGTSVPLVGSSFDFGPHLPPLTGKRLELDAWGWSAGELVHLGRSVFVPPEGLSLSDIVGLSRTVRLDWIQTPATGSKPAVLVDDGNVEDPGTLSFRWSTSVPGVTHGLWQVTTYPTSPTGPLQPAGVVAQGIADGDGGDFEIDFAPLLGQPKTLALSNQPLDYVGTVGVFGIDGTSPTTTSTTGSAAGSPSGAGAVSGAAIAIPDSVLAKLDLPKPTEFWVRILPFSKDTFRGAVSNLAHIDTRPPIDYAKIAELIKQQQELQKHPYEVDFDFTQPGAANLSLATCWSFTGWDPAAIDTAAFNVAKAATTGHQAITKGGANAFSYWIYLKVLASYPTSPLCATCYAAVGISLGGAKCADSGGLTGIPGLDDILAAGGQLIGALISVGTFLWDEVIVGTFNKVKDFVVDTLGDACALFASASVGADASDECHTLAALAVDVALIYFGIPPNLPNTEQAVQLAKGEIADTMADFAQDLGIPCDEIGTAASAAGKPELSCEAAINAMLDELGAQLQAAYHQEAKSLSGLTFPPGMKVVPHPAGQIQPSKFDITVTLKPGATPPSGVCEVQSSLQSGWYTGPVNTFGGLVTVNVKGLSGATVINQSTFGVGTVQSILMKSQFFSGWPFTFTTWKLPTPVPQADGSVSATATQYLFQPTPYDPVAVTMKVPGPSKTPGGGLTNYFQPIDVPWHSFGLHSGASYVAVLASPCFGFAKSTTPSILFDEGPGPATKGVGG